MTKHPWKSISNHIDPEKEEQLKWVKIEIENQVKTVIKLTKNINHGNKERNLRNKSEAIHLVEDFQKQYESLYSLYENLREQVKKNVGNIIGDEDDDNSSSTSNSDSESSYYSPGGSNTARTNININSTWKDSDSSSSSSDNQEPADQTSDLDHTILKDKLTSSSQVKKITNLDSHWESGEILKDLRIQENILIQKTAQIKDLEGQVESLKLEISTLICMEKVELKEHVECKSKEAIMQMKEEVESLTFEISTLCMEKRELIEQVECKSDEAMQMKEKISRLEAQVLEIEAKSKENERRFYSAKQYSEDNEKKYFSRISDHVAQANDMQLELDTLRNQKGELEGRFIKETEKSSSQVKGLMEHVNSLKNELANVNIHKNKLKLEIEKKSECLMIQIKNLKNESSLNKQRLAEEKEGLKAQVNDLESKIRSLLSTKTELEEQVKKLNHEASQSHGKSSQLQKSLSEKENKLTTEQKKFTDFQSIMSTKTNSLAEEVKNLKAELEIIENEKTRLQMDLDKEREESSLIKSQVEKISKSNFQVVERKVEEMAEEFRKQLEDKYRILSRRIRVAEQLQVENKEWYRKTMETYEQQNKDLKKRAERNEIELKNIKDMTLAANDVLTSLDSVALNFEECSANFLNRISKASCELKFAKHWATRKNKAVLDVKDDLDCLLAQLDDKEAEILVFREKVWKSENKIRELEKMVKEKEDAMLGLKEEKREAIRQLCVWIDYHRGRSDYYMKMLSEINPVVRKRAT